MKHGRTIAGTCALLLCAAVGGCGDGPPAPAARPPTVNTSAALARRVDLDYRGEPLDKVLRRLSAQHGIAIRIDRQVRKAWGPSAPKVYFRVREMQLGAALRVLLAVNGLAFNDQGQRLLVVPKGGAPAHMVTRVYPLTDLLGLPGGPADEAAWKALIAHTIEGNWDQKTSGGYIHAGPGSLVVAQSGC